jgi:hypothetical protein
MCFLVKPTPRPTAKAITITRMIKPIQASRKKPPRLGGRWFLRSSLNFSPLGPTTSVYSVYGGGFRLECSVGGNAKFKTRCIGRWCDLAGISGLMPPFSSIAPSLVGLATLSGDGVPLCVHPFGMGAAAWSSGIDSMLARFLMRVELQQPVLLLRMFETAAGAQLYCGVARYRGV